MANKMSVTKRVYLFLVEKAMMRETTTYVEIAEAHGLPTTGNALGAALSPILGSILEFCRDNKQPPLTALVVRKSGADQGMPGNGFWLMFGFKVENMDRETKRVITDHYQSTVFDHYAELI